MIDEWRSMIIVATFNTHRFNIIRIYIYIYCVYLYVIMCWLSVPLRELKQYWIVDF